MVARQPHDGVVRTSDQLLEGAWERRVLASLTESAGAVTRLDERTLRVTIDRSVLYDTRKPEVVSVAVPGAQARLESLVNRVESSSRGPSLRDTARV